MFYPQEMSEVELIVPEKDLLAVTRLLSGQGIFHQADGTYLSTEKESGSANPWQEKASIYASLERRIQNLMTTLEIEEGRPASGSDGMADIEPIRALVDEVEQGVKNSTDQIAAEHKRLEQAELIIKELQPIADLDLDISTLRNPHYLYSVIGMMPVENQERLQVSLARVPFVFLPLHLENKHAVVWLAGPRSHSDVLDRAARSAYLDAIALPEDTSGTPAQIIQSFQAEIKAAELKKAQHKSALSDLQAKYKEKLQTRIWQVRSSRMLTDAIVRYGRLRYTYLIVGWIITAGVEDLMQRVRQTSKETLIETTPVKRDSRRQDVPVSLFSNKLLAPFQTLVTTYGRPRYDELDPTILMTITFPLLFGAMFGDVGHGLIFAALGWLLVSKRVKSMRGMAGLGGLVIACGLSAVFFGFLYGSLFGKEDILPWHLIQPMEQILPILMIAIGAGVVLLSLGFILGIFNAWKRRDWSRALVEPKGIAGLVLYWSLIAFGLSTANVLPLPSVVFLVPVILSGIVVTLSDVFKHLIEGHRPLVEDGIGTYAIQAFFELFETVISFLSNSLSYVRVGAFAVAHGFLSTAVFDLGTLASPSHGLGYWIVLLIGTIIIIGLEGLIVTIQTMRLEYYEFFSKFFMGGGARFEPLTLRTNAEK
jgi:V/A-type H+/Na+-transporting ATPase subunit I